MKHFRYLLTFAFVFVLLIGASAISVSAQTRRGGGRVIVIQRPVIVRPYWGYSRFWNPWYNPYYYDPYLEAQRQRYYLQQELRGNQRELEKHLKKYNADGVITAKEREELDDDYRDVEKAKRKLAEFESRY